MSFTRFKPQIWHAVLMTALEKSLVYAAPGVVNRDYEGEIQQYGDTVRITSISDPTIGNYTANNTTIVPEELTDAQRTFTVDQSKYFAFYVDDIDKRQSMGPVLPEAMRRAAYRLRDQADQYVASLYTQVNVANRLNSGSAVTLAAAGKAYEALVDLGVKLDEANIPSEGRWCIIPPWFHGLMRKDANFINAEKSSDGGSALHNGVVGMAAGFSLRVSNNVPNPSGSDYVIMAGTDIGMSFAEQINKVEPYRPEAKFADAIKGLYLYGSKMVRPEAVVYGLITRPA